ncbi:hypothetical protein [Methylomonas methanica]|uniref:hypothetical protein n=1 Tax=Methylomonas methanica TaxID=421 RepID=UPI00067489C6|nr:hypothetical protein [Methylomonas methanica]
MARATLWSILAAYLLLPSATEVDLPMIPPMDKATIPNLSAFLICRFALGKRISLLPNIRWLRGLLLIYVTSPFITALLNADPIIAGPLQIKAMNSYDALSAAIRQSLFILPFLLGIAFVRDAKSHEDVLRILVVAALAYSLPMLFEVRMSPQLHRWFYGFFPHSFGQQKRGDGFRPVVFMEHGLLVAFFTMSALFAASTLAKLRKTVRGIGAGMVSFYLGVVLILCKSMASMIYALLLVGGSRIVSPAGQIKFARVLVMMVVVYPLCRATDWFPTNELVAMAAEVSELRAQSLRYRLDNEEILLHHARERGFFGWGSWGRNRVYDPNSGKDLSVTDGRWIIVMGEFGWVGYLAEFGLLALPVLRASKAIRMITDTRERRVFAAITSLLAISMFDLLPNASVSPWTWLLAGALLGRIEQLRLSARKQRVTPADSRHKIQTVQAA